MKTRYIALFIFILVVPITFYLTSHKNESAVSSSAKELLQTSSTTLSESTKESAFKIDHWTTQSGTKVYFIPTAGIPIVDIEIDFHAGSARDGDKPGLSNFCASALDQGTDKLNADEIAAQFDDVGATYGIGNDRDAISVSLRSLSDPKFFNPAIDAFVGILTRPSFAENAIDIVRNQILTGLQRNLQRPEVITKNAFFKAIYGDHPYAHPVHGAPESVASITREDLLAFHQRYFAAPNAVITLVGGITQEDAKALAELLSSALPVGNPAPVLPNVAALTKATQENIPFPSEQTHIFMGQPCMIQNDPDYFPLAIGDYILGSGFLNSRLGTAIREKQGLAYDVRSILSGLEAPGPFAIRLQTQNAQAETAISVVKETLAKFIQEGPTEAEVMEAKKGMIRALPLTINSNAKILSFVSNIAFYQLPLDYFSTYTGHINEVTTVDIKATLQRRLDPEKMVLIVVGTPTP